LLLQINNTNGYDYKEDVARKIVTKGIKMQRRIFILMMFVLLTLKTYSQDQNFYIFICFGQSNMEGQGKIGTQDYAVDERFQVMQAVDCANLRRKKGTWYTATPPLCRCNTGLSPVDYFGRTMIANLPSNIKVGVINVSVAGCKIELFDKINYPSYAVTAPTWMVNIIKEYGGNPYAHLVEIAKLAQKDGVIKGILLHQGESNVGDGSWTAKVKSVYNNLITDLNLEPTKTPLLAGEVVNADQGGICASANTMIATLPRAIPNAHVISSSGCADTTDNLHFNSAGYRELGKRYAAKMLSIINEQNSVDVKQFTSIENYSLEQNYPNPFNPETTISYRLKAASNVSLKVYDVLGREVATLVDEFQQPGVYNTQFSILNLPAGRQGHKLVSGIYFYRLRANNFVETKKFTILK
jgi:hypothetical protein